MREGVFHVLWRWVLDEKRRNWAKVPFQASGKSKAQADNPATWATWKAVIAAFARGGFDGIGRIRNGDEVYVDLDGCLDENGDYVHWPDWPDELQPARIVPLLEAFAYWEKSPSGRGLHAVVRDPRGVITRTIQIAVPGADHCGIAIYTGVRYFTVTGSNWDGADQCSGDGGYVLAELNAQLEAFRARHKANGMGTPVAESGAAGAPEIPSMIPAAGLLPPMSDEDVLARALREDRIRQLFYQGDKSAAFRDLSPSGADYALCEKFAFYSQKNAAQIDRLFRRSALMREKWDEKRGEGTYGEITIRNAIAGCSGAYDPEYRSAPAPKAAKRVRAAAAGASGGNGSSGEAPPPPPPPPDAETVPPPEGDAWQALLLRSRGKAINCQFNADIALRYAPGWIAADLVLDEFSNVIRTRGEAPWGAKIASWTDADTARAAIWMQGHGLLITPGVLHDAVFALADAKRVHPLREYLSALVWDGEKRIDRWLSTYLGAEETVHNCLAGAWWLGGAVARAFHPGAKVDYTLVLEGDQGVLKSTALRTLVGDEWFSDSCSNFSGKDAAIDLQGKWVIELGEIDRLAQQPSVVKAFLTRVSDHFRPPYERHSRDFPRHTVFAGTVNLEEYLEDSTGNRRFWPVKCATLKLELLARDRDQIWAEAVERYRHNNAVRWPSTPEELKIFRGEVSKREEVDVWHDKIAQWCDKPQERLVKEGGGLRVAGPLKSTPDFVFVAEILLHCCEVPTEKQDKNLSGRVGRTMRRMGWKREFIDDEEGKTRRIWYHPDYDPKTKTRNTKPAGEES